MVIRFADGKTTTIDYREMGPGAAHRNTYLDANGKYIAEYPIAFNVVHLFGQHPIGIGAVHEPRVNVFVALRIVFVLVEHTLWHGIGHGHNGGWYGIVLVGNIGRVLYVFF